MLVGGQKLLSMICPEMKYIIPLFCSSLFINETIRLQEVSSKYKDDKNKIQIIYDFIEFLKKNELDQYDMPNEFCSINLDLISPHIISNSIIELCKDNLVYIKNIAEELSRLLCETVSLIYYKDSDLETIINSARHFFDLSFRNIEICIEYDMLFDERSIEKLIKEIPLCSRIIIIKSYFKKMVNSKSVYNAFSFIQNDIGYTSYTSEINLNFINKLPTNIFPSLVQEKVEKEYEIRVFYFLGKFYSMAILSQNNKQTELDYRKYDLKKPNRFIPYKLSDKLKNKISLFMKKLNLNIGSLDFIKSTNGKIYFLEVNFMGQFGMVDFPCNYGIHKDIAEFLINFDKKDYEIY